MWSTLVVGSLASLTSLASAPDAGFLRIDGGLVLDEESANCYSCHKDRELEVDLESEEVQQLWVDLEPMARSVHASLACSDCHTDLRGTEGSHKTKGFKSRREYALTYSEQCKECHFTNYQKTLDSVHHALIERGKTEAAVCVDCHGAHDIGPAAEPRARISQTCAKCHKEVVDSYATSVHGEGLLSGKSPDVPTCTDCHRAHDIVDPRTGPWQLATPQMCGGCHTNEAVMKRYGLSTRVLETYLADFHGSTTLFQRGEAGAKPTVALCTDCHGVHDITRVDAPDSRVLQQNLVQVCKKCHPDATPSFNAAWMSHYEPTWEKAPLVFLVRKFYGVLIPFMIGGLILQIALHLWRVVVNR